MFQSRNKREKNKPKPKGINLIAQIAHMKSKFPEFEPFGKYKTNFGWIGKLKPKENSKVYTIKILFNNNKPKVYILDPEILDNAPHRYTERDLCLYYPKDTSYDERSIIADTIVPWTAEWLFYYEAWLEEGVWWGPEAPHRTSSKIGKKINEKYNR